MKTRQLSFFNLGLAAIVLSSLFFVGVTTSRYSSTSIGEYDPWLDLNADGEINIFDIVMVATLYDTTGTPINKTELLLELAARIDALNATVMALEEQISGMQGFEVRVGTQNIIGGWYVAFSPAFSASTTPKVFAMAVLTVDDPGPSNLLKGMCPYPAVSNVSNTGFTLILKTHVGGPNMMTATADIYYIAIGTESTSPTQSCAGIDNITVDSSSQVTITFTDVSFTNASSIDLSASAIVTMATTGEGYPARISGVTITTANATLTLECWNGSAYTSMNQDEMVQVSWVAVGE